MNVIEQAIELTQRNLKQFLFDCSFIPDDKLNWSPAPTAKTPLQIITHLAVSAGFIGEMIAGRSSTLTAEQAMQAESAAEAELTTKAAAIKVLENATQQAIATMKNLKESDLNTMVQSPFMPAPISFWLNLYWRHFDMHGGQIDYLQTCWGDKEFHFAG